MDNSQPITASPEKALQALVLDPDLEHLEDLLADFNLFDVLGIATREPQHSAFLAWLLDPLGSHGLRDYFLRRFLSEAANEARECGIVEITPLDDADGWKLTDVKVATERHDIDILLIDESDGFVCLIENKIRIGEHSDQLRRYLETVKYQYPGLRPFPIFLTPDGKKPKKEEDAERWVPLGYGKVASLIDRTLRTRTTIINTSVACFLKQYARTLGRHVLDTTNDIDELALQIYNNHKVAIDRIIKAKSAQEEPDWDVIDTVVKQYFPLLCADFNGKWHHRFYAPVLDCIPELKKGSGWTKSHRILLFEVKYREKVLDLVVGPGPCKTRKLLYDLAQNGVSGVHMCRSSQLAEKWHHIYRKPIVSSPFNSDEAESQIKQAIAEFFDNDYWPLVNAIRGEFGLPAASPLVSSPTG